VGCMVNGAGLAMATMDIVKLSGSVGDIKAVIGPPAPLSHGRQLGPPVHAWSVADATEAHFLANLYRCRCPTIALTLPGSLCLR
jgi:hypothetical protein